MRSTVLLLTLGTLLLGVTLACGGSDDVRPTDDAAVQEITVLMSDELDFQPGQIEVQAGVPVRLVIANQGTALHDFAVDSIEVREVAAEGSDAEGHGDGHGAEPDLHVAADGGQTVTLEFTALEAGEYEFICTVTGHADAGMVGRLLVI